MHRAKAFFVVCAGLFLLALSYHVGARNAQCQAVSFELATVDDGFSVLVGRTIYRLEPQPWSGRSSSQPVPGASPVVAIKGSGVGTDTNFYAALSNGDFYWQRSDSQGSEWLYQGNVLGAPTPAQRETWGRVKVRYRK